MNTAGKATVVLAVSAALVGALTPAGSARQMLARDEPVVSGPLAADPELTGCNRKKKRSQGKVVAVFNICLQWYRLDPGEEGDTANDYGSLWIKARVNAKNGWCATRVNLDTALPPKGVLSKAPRPGKVVEVRRGSKRSATRLVVDAQGDAPEVGTIRQAYLVRQGKMRALMKHDKGIYRVKWRGLSSRAIALAAGLELGWPQGEGPWTPDADSPPPWIYGRFVKRAGC